MWIKIRIAGQQRRAHFCLADSNVNGTMIALDRCFVLVIGLMNESNLLISESSLVSL